MNALGALRQTLARRRELDRILAQRVSDARAAGYTWAQIGAELGVTKQAAQQRYGA